MKVTVVMSSGREVVFEEASLHALSYGKIVVSEVTTRMVDRDGFTQHGFTKSEWKEVRIEND
jgi:hypothetical protein